MIGDRRNRLLNGLTASGVFVVGAAVFWAFAALSSWSNECPYQRLSVSGLDKEIQAWPPSAQCYDQAAHAYYWEAQSWVKPVILALLACAILILVASIVAAIRDRRSEARQNSGGAAA